MGLLWTPASQAIEGADEILRQIHGTHSTACTQDTDADTGEDNRLGPLTTNKRYLVYCHDGAGTSVACSCLVGTVTIDASAAVGPTIFPNYPKKMKFPKGKAYISCVPLVDNQYIDVCPLD